MIDYNGRKMKVGKQHDGDLEMYTDEALVSRQKLKEDPDIIGIITKFWNVLDLVCKRCAISELHSFSNRI